MNDRNRRGPLIRLCLGMLLFTQSYALQASAQDDGEKPSTDAAAVPVQPAPAAAASTTPENNVPESTASSTTAETTEPGKAAAEMTDQEKAAAEYAARKKAAMEYHARMQQMREERRKRAQNFQYPGWPEKERKRIERVPPPPPGPYMSSAMNGTGAENLSFERAERPSPVRQMAERPPKMEQFNPDLPWPSLRERPQKWEPETGYRFVDPMQMQRDMSRRQAPQPGISRPWYPATRPYQGAAPGGPSANAPYPDQAGYYTPQRRQHVPYRPYP